MGFLTTFTIYNDDADLILKHPKEFSETIHKATSSNESREYPLGNHCNFITAQKTRHMDDNTIYVHMGNTVVEMNNYSKDTDRIMKQHPEFFEKLLHEMEYQVKYLKKKYEEHKNEKST